VASSCARGANHHERPDDRTRRAAAQQRCGELTAVGPLEFELFVDRPGDCSTIKPVHAVKPGVVPTEIGQRLDVAEAQLRHTFAYFSLRAGVPISDLSVEMGHESIRLTHETYGHWSDEMGDRAANLRAAWAKRDAG
jgi:hypothetical protein